MAKSAIGTKPQRGRAKRARTDVAAAEPKPLVRGHSAWEGARASLLSRMQSLCERLVAGAGDTLIEQALAAPTAASGTAILLGDLSEFDAAVAAVDPLAASTARGVAQKADLLEREPTYSSEEVGKLLGITEAGVRKRLERGQLLAVRVRNDWRYPVLQFDRAHHEVRPGMIEFLLATPDMSPWMQFETLVQRPRGERVLLHELLDTDRRTEAIAMASGVGTHGA